MDASSQLLSVGDLIGEAVHYYRQNYLLIVQTLVFPLAGAALARICWQWGVLHFKDLTSLGLCLVPCLLGFLMYLCFFLVVALKLYAFVRMMNGQAADFISSYTTVKERLLPIIAVYLITSGAAFLLALLSMGAMAAAALLRHFHLIDDLMGFLLIILGLSGLLATFLGVGCFSFMAHNAIVVGNQSLAASLSEGILLIFGNLKRAILFTLLLMITVFLLLQPLSLPLVVLSVYEAVQHGPSLSTGFDPARVSFFSLVLGQTWEAIIQMITYPILYFAYGRFYRDLKMRQHGLDLFRKLEQLQSSHA